MSTLLIGGRTAGVVRTRLLGLVFVGLLALAVWLSYAAFTQRFRSFVPVTVRTSRVGLQLPRLADVKIRGVVVGEVRTISTDGRGARLGVGLDPALARTIPAGVTARIEPKTLFGEKYVALMVPRHPSGPSIRAGAVIGETRVSTEVEQVLADLYPLLRTVQPAQLNETLTALADALEGRGASLGRTLTLLDHYLGRMNPRIPLLLDDLRALGQVSDVYHSVVPDLADLLRNSVRTGDTLVAKQARLRSLFEQVTGLSRTARGFLETNGDDVVRASRLSAAQLPLLARYAPEYPCLFQGLDAWIPRMDDAFRHHTLHITLEVLPNSPTHYDPSETPRNAAHNGPHCGSLPHPPYSQQVLSPQPPVHAVDDGVHGSHGKFRPRPAPVLAFPRARTGGAR